MARHGIPVRQDVIFEGENKMREYTAHIAAIIAILTTASPLSAEVLYHVTDLGTIGGQWSKAYSINNAGQIVGEAEPDPNLYPPSHKWHAVLFDPTGDGNNIDLIASGDGAYIYGWFF